MDKQQFIKDLEQMLNMVKAKANSNLSLKRPLLKEQLQEFQALMENLSYKK